MGHSETVPAHQDKNLPCKSRSVTLLVETCVAMTDEMENVAVKTCEMVTACLLFEEIFWREIVVIQGNHACRNISKQEIMQESHDKSFANT